jgi:hypothetical protein
VDGAVPRAGAAAKNGDRRLTSRYRAKFRILHLIANAGSKLQKFSMYIGDVS